MLMYANDISFPDDIQVVGPISLNTRKNKRNLKKIADNRAKAVPESAAPSRPQRSRGGRRQERPKPVQAAQTAPVAQAVVPVAQAGSARTLLALPADVLALLMTMTGLSGVSGIASSCTEAKAALDGDFWRAMVAATVGPRGVMSHALAASLASAPRDGFRRWVFGLEGDWFRAFQGHARSHANVTEVLQHAEYLCGGLVRGDAISAMPFARAIADAAEQCVEELDEAREAVSKTVQKAEARRQVFGTRALYLLRESEGALAEKAMLARFAVQDEAPTFDYFEDWGQEEKQTLDADVSMDLAQQFLAVMEHRVQ